MLPITVIGLKGESQVPLQVQQFSPHLELSSNLSFINLNVLNYSITDQIHTICFSMALPRRKILLILFTYIRASLNSWYVFKRIVCYMHVSLSWTFELKLILDNTRKSENVLFYINIRWPAPRSSLLALGLKTINQMMRKLWNLSHLIRYFLGEERI